ncbi:hypothetical protein COO59_06400 [Mixta theicola]|uniref:Tlde1 domain-containing protein n=1 Tax=Mixta theicola TaxID=1458355 RepID=A0A2K1QCH4_9GAMM|nr:DUF2778 domain-containing protein [Mixta theicola]PNS12734.1 hypothetical protein COO59_06400 [Mixta theicola]GLR10320.1 hypothetical protein GCM10007905_30400 [Mixta theicola]
MTLQGKFVINNADYSPLNFPGLGTFLAFSGNGVYRNKGGCGMIINQGPLPAGKYYIVDRPSGSWFNSVRAWTIDKVKSAFEYHVDHSEWFALFRDDGKIDDSTFFKGVARGSFRLHPGQVSDGCITLASQSDFKMVRNALLRTSNIPVPGTDLKAYGTIEVITYGDTCP